MGQRYRIQNFDYKPLRTSAFLRCNLTTLKPTRRATYSNFLLSIEQMSQLPVWTIHLHGEPRSVLPFGTLE